MTTIPTGPRFTRNTSEWTRHKTRGVPSDSSSLVAVSQSGSTLAA